MGLLDTQPPQASPVSTKAGALMVRFMDVESGLAVSFSQTEGNTSLTGLWFKAVTGACWLVRLADAPPGGRLSPAPRRREGTKWAEQRELGALSAPPR